MIFKTIRFMRMYMTGFKESVVLRFGTLQLVRGEWRSYEQDLSDPKMPPAVKVNWKSRLSISRKTVTGIRVSYTLPRASAVYWIQASLRFVRENEQALSLKITDPAAQDARAVYKNTIMICGSIALATVTCRSKLDL